VPTVVPPVTRLVSCAACADRRTACVNAGYSTRVSQSARVGRAAWSNAAAGTNGAAAGRPATSITPPVSPPMLRLPPLTTEPAAPESQRHLDWSCHPRCLQRLPRLNCCRPPLRRLGVQCRCPNKRPQARRPGSLWTRWTWLFLMCCLSAFLNLLLGSLCQGGGSTQTWKRPLRTVPMPICAMNRHPLAC